MAGEVLQTVAAASGLGNHFALLNRPQQIAALKWSFLGQFPMLNGIGFGKLAVIAFLLRIQGPNHLKKKWFLYFIGGSGCFINLVTSVLLLVQCVPVERHWDPTAQGSCRNEIQTANFGFFTGSVFPFTGPFRSTWRQKYADETNP